MPQPQPSGKRVVIVGGGIGGMSVAIALKTKLGFENFTIYEKKPEFGGTWRDNTYPGCGCDIPAHWYSLSSEPNPNWSSLLVSQPEILEYWQRIHKKHDLQAKTVFNTLVYSSHWNEDTKKYTLILHNGETGESIGTTEADVLIYAVGELLEPKYPEGLAGQLNNFKGELGMQLDGDTIAQLVPVISEDSSVQITNFYRTPHWYLPRGNYKYSKLTKWLFNHIPVLLLLYRWSLFLQADVEFIGFWNGSFINKMFAIYCKWYIRHHAPKEYAEELIPKYSPGCKRIVLDPGYLDCLSRPNVSLSNEPVEGIVDKGLKLQNGNIKEFDVIIFATGYTYRKPLLIPLFSPSSLNLLSQESPDLMRLQGRNGKTLKEFSDERGGPSAYLGGWVPEFPNCSILLGPNVAGGHSSTITMEELQTTLLLNLIKPVLYPTPKNVYDIFEVKPEAFEKYNTWLQKRLNKTVWVGGCGNWYRVKDQEGSGEGKVVMMFPGQMTLFWWLNKKIKKGDWIFTK
ncbi:hypothetical protein DL96DRAFT_1615026 [Flagelloscypha sp. PMI_526]|nr:hypothetical protein DL96DRAFT_1615026 [Flagelloscypha sp. PMI_526]